MRNLLYIFVTSKLQCLVKTFAGFCCGNTSALLDSIYQADLVSKLICLIGLKRFIWF
jgi:hypothetical protein